MTSSRPFSIYYFGLSRERERERERERDLTSLTSNIGRRRLVSYKDEAEAEAEAEVVEEGERAYNENKRNVIVGEGGEDKKIRVTTFFGKQRKSRKRSKKPKKTTTTTKVNTDMYMKKKQRVDTRHISNNSNNKYSFGINVSLFSYWCIIRR